MAQAPPASKNRPPEARPRTRPAGPLAERLLHLTATLAGTQRDLVVTAAEFADSAEWALAGWSSAAAWLADTADVEACTAREWIRIGRCLPDLPTLAEAYESGVLSYSKVRTLTRVATPENEAELVALAAPVPAGDLGQVLAGWMNRNHPPEEVAAHQHRQRSVQWRTEPDGMVTITLRLPPRLAMTLISPVTTLVMRTRPQREPDGTRPSLAQQKADALETVLAEGRGTIDTEIVLHLRGDGATYDDGTPVADTVIADLIPQAFIRVLIHDAHANPIDASPRRRHPTARQKRLVKERDRRCIDCGRTELLEYDHGNPPGSLELLADAHNSQQQEFSGQLELRCAPCHRQRHRPAA